MEALYNTIGVSYSVMRRTDPTIAARLNGLLKADLKSGDWAIQNQAIMEQDALDVGYRLIKAAVRHP